MNSQFQKVQVLYSIMYSAGTSPSLHSPNEEMTTQYAGAPLWMILMLRRLNIIIIE